MSTMSKMPIGSMVSLGVLAILCWFAVPVQGKCVIISSTFMGRH